MATVNEHFLQEAQAAKPLWEAMLPKMETMQQEALLREDALGRLFTMIATTAIQIVDLDKRSKHSLADWQQANNEWYSAILPDNYEQCYFNPTFVVNELGKELGHWATYLYGQVRIDRGWLNKKRYDVLASDWEMLLQAWEQVKEGKAYPELLTTYVAFKEKTAERDILYNIWSRYSPEHRFYVDIIETADLDDLSYLYQYGNYITENEHRTAQFINSYPEEELTHLGKFIVESYYRGFSRGGRDIKKKKYVNVFVPIGYEKLARIMFKELRKDGLEPVINMMLATPANKQLDYDLRFSSALLLNREYAEKEFHTYETVLEQMKDTLAYVAGPIYVETFGEKPFSPVNCPDSLKLTEEQTTINREFNSKRTAKFYSYYRREESSFSIIAFPSPEIGDKFEAIFADTVRINLLDSNKWEEIQQYLIDALDQADYVHVKGKAGNRTDIKVQMHPLEDPTKQTLFENCVADVNIPVGEVFTSPKLTGTNGTLHVSDIYLGNLRYKNLELLFENGYAIDYHCSNFETAEENKNYVAENLMFPHKKLPLGEFAIGTNTTAYVVARKYDILPIMPILIVEKMGPHFAIGDTCFSWEEDTPTYNPLNKKQIIAKDNEHSLLRKEDPLKAYTQCHTDITLPYDELDYIRVVRHDGSTISLLEDGCFVLPGTEMLNEALQEG